MNFVLFLCYIWPMLAAVTAVPYLGAGNDAKVLFDENGPVLAVMNCQQLTDFNIRTFSRFLLMDDLDCGERTQHITIEAGMDVFFFAEHTTLSVANIEVVVEKGAQLTFAAQKRVLFERGQKSPLMFRVEGTWNVYAGGFEDVVGPHIMDFKRMETALVTTIGDGTFGCFDGSIVNNYNYIMSVRWPRDMEATYYTVVSSKQMVTEDELAQYNLNSFSTPTGEPSTGPSEEFETTVKEQLSTSDAVNTSRCHRHNLWCRSKALITYVFRKLRHFAFGDTGNSKSGSNNGTNKTRDASDKAQKKGRVRRLWGAAKRFGRGAKDVVGLVAEHLKPATPEHFLECALA